MFAECKAPCLTIILVFVLALSKKNPQNKPSLLGK